MVKFAIETLKAAKQELDELICSDTPTYNRAEIKGASNGKFAVIGLIETRIQQSNFAVYRDSDEADRGLSSLLLQLPRSDGR